MAVIVWAFPEADPETRVGEQAVPRNAGGEEEGSHVTNQHTEQLGRAHSQCAPAAAHPSAKALAETSCPTWNWAPLIVMGGSSKSEKSKADMKGKCWGQYGGTTDLEGLKNEETHFDLSLPSLL